MGYFSSDLINLKLVTIAEFILEITEQGVSSYCTGCPRKHVSFKCLLPYTVRDIKTVCSLFC